MKRIPTAGRRKLLDPSSAFALLAVIGWLLGLEPVGAEQAKPFPEHWGEVPKMQTRDYVEWPDGYGHGSGTVARWIADHVAKDQGAGEPSVAVLYSADFNTVKAGELPEDFMVLNGEFAVREEGGTKFMELPGAPVESFAVMFGPAGNENLQVSARMQGTSQGRRYPAFALGINGLGGYRLKLTPAKRSLELFRGPEDSGEVVNSASFSWKSGEWANLRLQVRKTGEQEWRVEGKAWMEGSAEPSEWMVSFTEQKEPSPGRAFVGASPFSGTPIRFAELVVKVSE